MRLLVTRPLPDAERTAARLRAAGHTVLVQPLLAIVFSPPPAEVPKPAALLVTSQNGIRALARWPQARAWRRTPLFATGAATAREATAFGFTDVRVAAGDADLLANAVQAAISPGAGPLIYPAARDRSGFFADGLTARCYDVNIIEAYRADVAPRFDEAVRAALVTGGLDGVLLYSRRTADAFVHLATAAAIGDRLAGVDYFALSREVADGLAALPGRIHVAARPDEDSLVALIPPPA
jgi:uroporphyrinogen-III synthase